MKQVRDPSAPVMLAMESSPFVGQPAAYMGLSHCILKDTNYSQNLSMIPRIMQTHTLVEMRTDVNAVPHANLGEKT